MVFAAAVVFVVVVFDSADIIAGAEV